MDNVAGWLPVSVISVTFVFPAYSCSFSMACRMYGSLAAAALATARGLVEPAAGARDDFA
jgi:hypothetical protein